MEVPEAIRRTLKVLREEYGSYIELKRIRNTYGVFEATSKYDSATGKARKITHYLGHITQEGVMIPARRRPLRERKVARGMPVEGAAGLLEQEATPSRTAERTIRLEEKVITNLSMNSRMPVRELAKRLKTSAGSAASHIKRAEERYSIMRVPEINVAKLGYIPYLIQVKFLGEKPTIRQMTETLSGEPMVQLAMLLEGDCDYDLLMYVLVSSISVAEGGKGTTPFLGLESDFYELRKRIFSGYTAEWRFTHFFGTYGCLPLRDEFFEMLKSRIWRRSREQPRPAQFQILEREYNVLRELNGDASTQFAAIDEKYGYEGHIASNTYNRLRDEGIIVRPTITMENPPVKYVAVIQRPSTT